MSPFPETRSYLSYMLFIILLSFYCGLTILPATAQLAAVFGEAR